MGLFDGSMSQGGSVNSAQSGGWSQSGTNALDARSWSEAQAAIAFERQLGMMREMNEFNAQEAQKTRDWQENMANTIYTRSTKNMREAGINPILAANMGLSGANVSSGATASASGAPSAPLAQNFMDSWSASQNASESHGSSWQSSASGLATGLAQMGKFIGDALANLNTGLNLNMSFDGLQKFFSGDNQIKEWADAIKSGTEKLNNSRENESGEYRNGTWWDRGQPDNSGLWSIFKDAFYGG